MQTNMRRVVEGEKKTLQSYLCDGTTRRIHHDGWFEDNTFYRCYRMALLPAGL